MSTISGIDPAASLGQLVAQRPARAPLFEELRLDYCCGVGRQHAAVSRSSIRAKKLPQPC